MLRFLGTLLFGAAYTGGWIQDKNNEQTRRQNAKNNKIPFYYDKDGIMRHSGSGKKYTKEEVHILFNGNKEEEKQKRKKAYKEKFELRYFAVLNPYKHFVKDVFLSYEEANDYIKRCKDDGKIMKDEPEMLSKAHLETKYFTYNLHFKEEKNE